MEEFTGLSVVETHIYGIHVTLYVKAEASAQGVQKSLTQELISLAKRVLIVVAISWISLFLFEVFLAKYFGIMHTQVQITSSIVIIGISFVVIRTVRKLIRKTSPRIGLHLSSVLTFSIIVTVFLLSILALMNVWEIDIEAVLISGGAAAIIIGFVISTIAGNIFSGGLMLTTFPAKVGDSIFIVNDNIRGTVGEVSFLYTKVISDVGTEYIVPNTAIVQGAIRIIKEPRAVEVLPFSKNEHIEIVDGAQLYRGTVTKITQRFTYVCSDNDAKEFVLSNSSILSGKYLITKEKN